MTLRTHRRQLSLLIRACERGCVSPEGSDRPLGTLVLAVLWWLGLAGEAWGQTAGPVLAAQGARCRFLAECSQFDAIGVHLGTSIGVRTDARRSQVDAQGGVRLALTAGEVAEVGASVAAHLVAGELRVVGSPVTLLGRLRLLPLPLGPLAAAPLRLALSYQHELVVEPLGTGEAPGWSRGTLRLVAGQRLGRFELDGSVGLVLAQPDGQRLRAVGYELAAGASLRLLGGGEPGPELDLTAEALARAAVGSALPSQQALLLGLLGKTRSGYGGGLALGVAALDGQAGVLAMARLQISWGKAHRNPWAERKAAEPETTPAFIWMLLGAIDPVLGSDGCVWTDPKPQRPSRQWFCVGHPAPDDPGQIVLPNQQRIAVGTHLWELGKSLWLNDGTKVVEIPLVARYRQKVWEYLAEHWPDARAGDPAVQPLCEGKIGLLHGLDQGSAMMVAHDDGGGAALLGAELLRELQCNPDPSLRDQALQTFSVLGLLRRRGPVRARPPLSDRLSEGAEGAAAPRRAGGGAKEASVADHTVPPRLGPAIVSDQARKHVLTGELTKNGEAKGWHYEPTGEAQKGTYILEPTRSAADAHGIYEANVMIEGVKKKARSSFFPTHWTPDEVERAIEEAYRSRSPLEKGPKHIFKGQCSNGLTIQMELDSRGAITTAYPLREGVK